MKVKLSGVIITYNEEKNIARCLESIKKVVDEIVVVDSYSTDRTEEICLRYDVRFIKHTFYGHIEQKNWAINQATHPCILSLDADECLSETLTKSILAVKNDWKYDGYYFNRLTNYCGKWIRHTSWYPSRKLRLWDSTRGAWGGFNPHDKFILRKGASRKFLKGDILHYSYYTFSEHIDQINKFSTILAESYFQRGRRLFLIDLVAHPLWRFLKDYILKGGFLDGYYGLVVSVNSAHETFLKYIKLRNYYLDYTRSQRNAVCFFNSTPTWGGGEKWHFEISRSFHARNHPVIVFTNRRADLWNKVVEANIPSYKINVSNLSFLNPFKIIRISRILKKERVRVIIMNLSADMKVAGLAARLAGVDRIIYRRGSAIPVRNSLLNRYLFKNILTDIIVNSYETKRTLLTNNPDLFDANKIKVIYNGLKFNQYEGHIPTPLYHRKNNEIVLGNAGRLVRQKGQEFLIDLAEVLKKRNANFRILIAGEGKLDMRLREYARTKGVEDRIVFMGFLKDMKSFMDSIDIFVLSSRWEGFGYVIVEAMAMAKPVVAFDVSSNPEIIDDNVNGYLVPPFDIEVLADKVMDLMKDPGLRGQFGMVARQTARERFDYNESLNKVESYIFGH
ncbi:MAG: glycosyltransferase [Bacteroidales bacterium]|nr:glycosyltransferase [Bacteroidales bacterium]MBN2698994.1 glycosyltransferase [Bacteroidales bacterium]